MNKKTEPTPVPSEIRLDLFLDALDFLKESAAQFRTKRNADLAMTAAGLMAMYHRIRLAKYHQYLIDMGVIDTKKAEAIMCEKCKDATKVVN